jgi:hypothetical protein
VSLAHPSGRGVCMSLSGLCGRKVLDKPLRSHNSAAPLGGHEKRARRRGKRCVRAMDGQREISEFYFLLRHRQCNEI